MKSAADHFCQRLRVPTEFGLYLHNHPMMEVSPGSLYGQVLSHFRLGVIWSRPSPIFGRFYYGYLYTQLRAECVFTTVLLLQCDCLLRE